ncbi:MAG: hypothetical protein QW303_01710 [Nitrososphaerota archaeon]
MQTLIPYEWREGKNYYFGLPEVTLEEQASLLVEAIGSFGDEFITKKCSIKNCDNSIINYKSSSKCFIHLAAEICERRSRSIGLKIKINYCESITSIPVINQVEFKDGYANIGSLHTKKFKFIHSSNKEYYYDLILGEGRIVTEKIGNLLGRHVCLNRICGNCHSGKNRKPNPFAQSTPIGTPGWYLREGKVQIREYCPDCSAEIWKKENNNTIDDNKNEVLLKICNMISNLEDKIDIIHQEIQNMKNNRNRRI